MAITCCYKCTEETGRHPGCECAEYLRQKEILTRGKDQYRQNQIMPLVPKWYNKLPQR